jgi:hypothetical protein
MAPLSEVDLIELWLIETCDIDKAAARIGGNPERRVGHRDFGGDFARCGVDHRNEFAFRAGNAGGFAVAGHGDARGFAGDGNTRHDLLCRKVEHADLIARLIGNEGFGGICRAAAKEDGAGKANAPVPAQAARLDQFAASTFFFKLSRPAR